MNVPLASAAEAYAETPALLAVASARQMSLSALSTHKPNFVISRNSIKAPHHFPKLESHLCVLEDFFQNGLL